MVLWVNNKFPKDKTTDFIFFKYVVIGLFPRGVKCIMFLNNIRALKN